MKHLTLPILLLTSLFVASATALGEPNAQIASATFSSKQVFEHVTTTTAFACNKRDASGRTYGTAHEFTIRTTSEFRPDGLVDVRSDSFHHKTNASYSIASRVVTLRFFDDQGKQISTQELRLPADGTKLGHLRKVPAKP